MINPTILFNYYLGKFPAYRQIFDLVSFLHYYNWRAGLIDPLHLTPIHCYPVSLVEQGTKSKGCAKYMHTLSF